MAKFFSYSNDKSNLRLFYDIDCIESVALYQDKIYTEDCPKRGKTLTVLNIHFKNTERYDSWSFDLGDDEGRIIYNALTDFMAKNS